MTYLNDKGQFQSPVLTLPETTTFRVRHQTLTKPTPYIMVWGYVPVDTKQCQCPSKFKEHTTMMDTPLDLLRCDRPAAVVAVENTPRTTNLAVALPPDGFIVAYSCCDPCRDHILTSHGLSYAKFTTIVP